MDKPKVIWREKEVYIEHCSRAGGQIIILVSLHEDGKEKFKVNLEDLIDLPGNSHIEKLKLPQDGESRS